jgi:hypothetical protein
MRAHIWTAAVLILAGASLPVQAQTKLEWKFTEGEKFYLEEVTDQKMTMGVMGQEFKINSKTTKVTSYTVKRVAGAVTTMEMKIESVEAKTDNAQFGGGMDKMQEKFQGATFTFTLQNGKVSKLEGFDEFVKKLVGDDDGVGKIAKMFLTEDTIKSDVEGLFDTLPNRAVNKGDKWTRDQSVSMGPMGTLKNANDYVYKSTEPDGELVTFKGKVSWVAPKGGADGGLFKITKANFKSDDARGTLLFDASKGRLVRGTRAMIVRGTMTLDIMGNEIDMDMTQDTSVTQRVLAKNPKAD